MRVKWNRNLDGSQAQQKSEDQAVDSTQEKGAVPDRPPTGGFLKIFRLKRHKKTKHSEHSDGRQDDSSESCRPVDDNVSRSELPIAPSEDDRSRNICEDSGQYTCSTGLLLRSVSVSQSRRGSEDYSDLKYRSLPSVGKGWFSFASRKSWLNLSSRGHRGSKDEKKFSASSQSIPAKKSEKLIEENILRESPERPVKCYSENSFPCADNRDDVPNKPSGKDQKSLCSEDNVTALSSRNQVDDIKSLNALVEGNGLESLPSDKTESSKRERNAVPLPDDGQNDLRSSKDKNVPPEIFSKSLVPQYVGKTDNSVLKCVQISKKSYPQENLHVGIAPKKILSLIPNEKNSETLQNRKAFLEIERCQQLSDDSRRKGCDTPPSIAGNHHSSERLEQSVTNDTLFHSVISSPKEDTTFSISQNRTSLCQTEHEQVTVERSVGGRNNSLPRGDNGEKNQQRNGIPSRLTTAGFESSAGQMKSLGSGITTGGEHLASWPREVTHRTAAVPGPSKDGSDVEHQIPNSMMFCCSSELSKKPTENNCTKWYVPICDIREETDNDCAVVIPPKFLHQVNSSPTVVCESNKSGGEETNQKHDQVSENNLFLSSASNAGSSCEEKETNVQKSPEEQTTANSNLKFSNSSDSRVPHNNGICRTNSDTQISLNGISLDIRDMNERNRNFSHCANGLQGEMNIQYISSDNTDNKLQYVVGQDLNDSSRASEDNTGNSRDLDSTPLDATFSELVISADDAARDLEKLRVAYSGVMDNLPPGKQTPNCSLIAHDSEKADSDVANHFNSNSFEDSSSPLSCVNFESTPVDAPRQNKDPDDACGKVDLSQTEEVINQVEKMISASFQSCCYETPERKLKMRSKIRKFPLSRDFFEDILQKSVSSDSGISEEIQEMCLEELKCESHSNKEVKSSRKSLHPFTNLEERGKDKITPSPVLSDFHVRQGNGEEENAEKLCVQSNYYSEQQPDLSLSNDSHASNVMLNNHVQGDEQICTAQVNNGGFPENDNSSPEIDDESLKQGTKSTNEAIPEEISGVIEQADHSCKPSIEVRHEKIPINFPNENIRLHYTSPSKLPFCSSDIEPEMLFLHHDMEKERTFGDFSWEGVHDASQTVRIYTLIRSSSKQNHGYTLRGDRTSHIVDIFSSDYTPTYIFSSECYCYDVLYSYLRSYLLPYSVHQSTSRFVRYLFESWENINSHPHLNFNELCNSRIIGCIPFSPCVRYTFCTPHDEVIAINKYSVPEKDSTADLELNTSVFGLTPVTDVGVHTADKDTQCELVSNCESEECLVELKSTNSKAVPLVQVNDSEPLALDFRTHPSKLVKKSPVDKTDSPSKDRMVLRKSRIPRSKHGSVRVLHHPSPKPIRPPMWLSRAELSQEIQHLGTLCEARTKELNLLKMKLKHATLGFDAFAAVFKYLTEDLDALSHPQLVKELAKTQKLLHQAKSDIICYEKQIEELKTHHAKELAELSEKMLHVYQSELQQVTNKQNEELSLLEEQHQKKMVSLQTSYVEASEKAKVDRKKEVDEIRQKFLKQKEEAELLHQSEMKHLEESHLEVQKSLQAEIEQLKVQYAESKQQSRSIEETLQKDTDTKLQWISSKKAELDKEVDSLKAVLEMKNNEIHSLRKENLEMQKELEELPVAKEKIKMLQARAEDLQALMAEKVRVERQLSTEYQTMKDVYERESKTNKRLSMENEELQWRLKQASELSLLLRSQTNSPDVLETPSPPKSPWQQQSPQQQNSRSKFYVSDPSSDPESPQAKSPTPTTASRSKFFTFVDPSEYDPQSPHSPRYKRLTPSASSPCKQLPLKNPVKLPLASTPRKSKVSTEAQPGGGTPRKMSKKQGGKTSPLPKTSDEEAVDACNVANNILESMESSISSEDSSLPSRDLEDPMVHICTSTRKLPDDKTEAFASLAYDKSPKPESDVSILGEATDPKKYYHMTFPVLKETGTDCDGDDGNSYLLLENSENCFVTAKEIGDSSITRNGYANPDGMTSSELDDKVSDLIPEGVVSHKMDPGVSEVVNRITSGSCENLSTRDGICGAEDSKAVGDVADT